MMISDPIPVIVVTIRIQAPIYDSVKLALGQSGLERRSRINEPNKVDHSSWVLVKEIPNGRKEPLYELDIRGTVAQLSDFLRRLERILRGYAIGEAMPESEAMTPASIAYSEATARLIPAWLPGLIVWICAIFLVCLALKQGVK